MSHALLLGAKVTDVVAVCVDLNRDAGCDRNAEVRKLRDFIGIVGHKTQGLYAETAEHGRGGRIIPEIVRKAEGAVCLDGVESLFLERIGLQLVEEAYTASLLTEVEEDTLSLRFDLLQCALQLFAAVAALGPEDIACHAFGVHAAEDIVLTAHLSLDKREVFEAAQRIEKAVDFKIAEGTRERGARRFFERIVVALAVAHQVLDADDAKAFALGEGEQFFGAHHLPVFAHNLAAETGGF